MTAQLHRVLFALDEEIERLELERHLSTDNTELLVQGEVLRVIERIREALLPEPGAPS